MSMNKNIARLAVTAGLTAALSFGGVMAPVTMAFADGAAGSTVTFEDDTYSSTTTYKGIQIFTADVDGTTVKIFSGQVLVSSRRQFGMPS